MLIRPQNNIIPQEDAIYTLIFLFRILLKKKENTKLLKPIFEKYILNKLPNDKHLHFLYGLIIVLLPFWTAWFGFGMCIFLSFLKEIYDAVKENGHFDIYDILVGVGAGAIGLLLRLYC